MPGCRDWDFHKYIQNVISFLPHYHHSDIYTQKCQQACFILHQYVAMGTAQGSQMEEDRQCAECCAGSRGCSMESPQSK